MINVQLQPGLAPPHSLFDLSWLQHSIIVMHQIFSITEILNEILQYLRKQKPCALSNVAQACRFLEDPALDVLWSTQYSLVLLIKVASESIEETFTEGLRTVMNPLEIPTKNIVRMYKRMNSTIKLPKSFSLYEKERISRYASRIQSLPPIGSDHSAYEYCSDFPQVVSANFLLELFQGHSASLFPRLRNVSFPLQGIRDFSLLSFFLSPELQELQFTERPPEWVYLTLAFMPCRGLRKLELPMIDANSLDRFGFISRFVHSLGFNAIIPQFHHLEELHGTITLSHWKAIATALQLLRTAQVSIVESPPGSNTTQQSILDSMETLPIVQPFTFLSTLILEVNSISSCIPLLMLYPLPSVQCISLRSAKHAQDEDLDTLSQIPNVFRTQLSSSLRSIYIRVATKITHEPFLSPLSHFHEMKKFTLIADWTTVDLLDGDIEELAIAWPNLRHFEIGSYTYNFRLGRPDSLTLMALFFFARYCPHISVISGLHIRITRWPDDMFRDENRLREGYEAPNLKSLIFTSCSPFKETNTLRVAILVSDIFPNVTEVCWKVMSAELGEELGSAASLRYPQLADSGLSLPAMFSFKMILLSWPFLFNSVLKHFPSSLCQFAIAPASD
ncbi:hypothetical protein ABKN59_011258 [Abortiporus biennis]